MKLLSIQVGRPKVVYVEEDAFATGIYKDPVAGPVMLRTTNLDGDGQADLRVHGGPDKAVYGYPVDAYEEWRKLRPHDAFPFGAMGENFSFETLDEAAIRVDDSFELGAALVQAVQPRFPCSKLAAKFRDPGILRQFMTLGRSGVYFRVLREGFVASGNVLKLVETGKGPTIRELFRRKR